MKNIDSCYVAWHLFSRSPLFNISVGLTQCFGAILIVINRTKLIGALILLPILFNIFIIDVSFTMSQFGFALTIRLAGMIICDLLILYYYKTQMIATFKILTQKVKSDLIEKWWVYLLLLISGFLMDFAIAIFTWPLKYLLNHFFPN